MINTANKKLFVALVLVFLFLKSGSTLALTDNDQKILELRQQIEELTKLADQYKNNIGQKQKEADTLKRQIDILNNQILQIQTKITITGKQIGSAKIEISSLEGQIFDTQENIGRQKNSIGRLIAKVYERDQLSLVEVLIKNPRLSDFAVQAREEESLNANLTVLLGELKRKKEQLDINKEAFETKKAELERLNVKQKSQEVSLNGNKQNKDSLLKQTRGQEKEYQRLLSEVEKRRAVFFEELQSLEAAALKSGAVIVRVTAKSVPPRDSKVFNWPYEDFILTQSYGRTAYARRGAYGGAPHNGIDIVSGWGSPIHAIADGTILASGVNNGWGNWAAVRHANDLVSLYSHMNAPTGLSNGTPVTTGSVIGYEGATGNVTGSHLHLSVYRDFFTFINEKNGQLYFNYFDGTLNPLDYLP